MSGPDPDPQAGPSPEPTAEAPSPSPPQPVTEPGASASSGDWEAPTLVRPGSVDPTPAPEREDVPIWLQPGHTLADRYTVLDKLGQGGMGVVVSAYDARLDRRVALKLLRRGSSPEEELEEGWLVREAQAMARLNHPHVVGVYDAGSLESGSLFIAMEFIQGKTLRRWCKEEKRSWRQVLEAYMAAAQGLAAAHAAGLIHRDFKADNVLVGQDGRVRVTDFGLARTQLPEAVPQAPKPEPHAPTARPSSAAPTDLTITARPSGSWSSALTLPGMIMGTPAYMAPELFRGGSADVRTDLFAFCASLYEALFGQLPFRGSTPTDLTRAQLEGKVVTPPSASEVPAWVTRTVLWGLQPEPDKRPASMEALLAALADDPEVKRQALWRRASVGLVMVGLAGLALWGWTRQQAPVDRCAQVRQQLEGVWDADVSARVRQALLGTQLPYAQDTFQRVSAVLEGYAGAWEKQRREVCEIIQQQPAQALGILVRREDCLERRRSQLRAFTKLLSQGPDPELLPRAVQVAQSLPPLEYCADAKALSAAVPPPEDPAQRAQAEALQQRLDGLEALLDTGKYKEGVALGDTLLPQVEPVGHPPLHARALFLGALARDGTGDYAGAEAMARQAALLAARGKDLEVAARAAGLIYFLVGYRQARHAEAALLELGMEVAVELADDDLIRANASNSQGIIRTVRGQYEEAQARYERAITLREKVLGPEHVLVMPPLNNLGNVLEELGHYKEALRIHERVVALREKTLGPQHPDLASALGNLGNVYTSLGRYEEARQRHERALAIREQALGPEHPLLANPLINLGGVLLSLGRYDDSLRSHERALALQEKALGAEHPRVAGTRASLGLVLEALGRYAEARHEYERALAVVERALGVDHPELADALSGLGRLAEAEGRFEEARRRQARALALREKALGAEHPFVAISRIELGSALLALGRAEEAERLYTGALASLEKALGAEHPELADALLGKGRVLRARGRSAEALPLLERALSLASPRLRARAQLSLAQALWESGQDRPRALALASEAQAHWRSVGHPRLAEASRWLAAHAVP